MKVSVNTKSFEQQMNNIINYSFGFIDGAQNGKKIFLTNLGVDIIDVLKKYVDTSARLDKQALHHIYEWYQTGSPESRLYDIDFTVSNLGLSFKSNFKQSQTLSHGSKTPFYNKASIMESGTPVTISPKESSVLVFENNGETIFTKSDILIRNPGGAKTVGSFERVVDEFFLKYFKQSFIRASGLYEYISYPVLYKTNFRAGSKGGRSTGIDTGFKWIVNAKVRVE